jgi:hypothetical protein
MCIQNQISTYMCGGGVSTLNRHHTLILPNRECSVQLLGFDEISMYDFSTPTSVEMILGKIIQNT